MTNILIRDVPEEVLAAINAKAKRIGLICKSAIGLGRLRGTAQRLTWRGWPG